MNKTLKQLCSQGSFDRFIMLLVLISSAIALVSGDQIREASIGVICVSGAILIIRFLIYSLNNRPKGDTKCCKRQSAERILNELANEMNVKLHTTRSLDIVPKYRGASSFILPSFYDGRLRCLSRVRIGCIIICGLDNVALEGIIAHELAHLKRHHSIHDLTLIFIFVSVLVYLFILGSPLLFPLIAAIWTLVFSWTSWRSEYEADAVAANYIGKEDMTHALKQFARLVYRPSDTLLHPSFKKRISRLSGQGSDVELNVTSLR